MWRRYEILTCREKQLLCTAHPCLDSEKEIRRLFFIYIFFLFSPLRYLLFSSLSPSTRVLYFLIHILSLTLRPDGSLYILPSILFTSQWFWLHTKFARQKESLRIVWNSVLWYRILRFICDFLMIAICKNLGRQE